MSALPRLHNESDFPAAAAHFLLPGPAGVIECLSDVPAASGAQPAVAVLCHPHPQHGGTMRNKVVTITERALRELGLKTLRFNFRGVGDSSGTFGGGDGELEDLKAVIAWVQSRLPDDELWLAGFSFGAWVAARAAAETAPRQLLTIAPPVERADFAAFQMPGCHWLVIQGDEDEVVNPQAVADWVAQTIPAPELVVMKQAGHYFHRRLMDLRGLIKNCLHDHLPLKPAS
mgnify:CR=1 FL=1